MAWMSQSTRTSSDPHNNPATLIFILDHFTDEETEDPTALS